jgi:hypothetical protein
MKGMKGQKQTSRKPSQNGRKPRKLTPREPLGVSVTEALTIVPIGKTKLFEALANGTIKSCLRFGVRIINYQSLKAAVAPDDPPVSLTKAEAREIAKEAAHAE